MISITVHDNGRVYSGDSWATVLVRLHKDQLVPEKTELRYMRAVARRTKMWNGSLIRCSNPELFFRDLEEQGLLSINILQ